MMKNCFLVNGYNQCLIENRTSKGGGVVLQVKNNCTLVKDFPNDLEKALSSEISKNGYLFRVLVVYNKPRAEKLQFVETLDKNL